MKHAAEAAPRCGRCLLLAWRRVGTGAGVHLRCRRVREEAVRARRLCRAQAGSTSRSTATRAFYKLGFNNQPQREHLERSTGTLQLAGKLRQGIGTFDFRANSEVQRDELAHDHDNTVFEAAYSIRPSPGFTLEAGKRALKWGKGYAWNPVGFVERPKDAERSRSSPARAS